MKLQSKVGVLAVLLSGAWISLSSAHAEALLTAGCREDMFCCKERRPAAQCNAAVRNMMLPGHPLLVAQAGGEENQEPVSPPGDDASAEGESQEREASRYRRIALAIAIGAAHWPNVHNVEPNPAIFNPDAIGRPNAWGISVELAGHLRVYTKDRWDLLLGADLGFVNMENSKSFDSPGTTPGTEQSRLLTQMVYFTPSVKFYYHTGVARPFIGAGIGGYFLELAARTERGELLEKFLKKEAFGGYASLGVDMPIRLGSFGLLLRLEDKFHLVDFGSLGNFSPSSGSLTGPINMIQFGFGMAL